MRNHLEIKIEEDSQWKTTSKYPTNSIRDSEYTTFLMSASDDMKTNNMVMDRKNEYLLQFNLPGLPEVFLISLFLFNPVLYCTFLCKGHYGLELILEDNNDDTAII